MCGMVKKPENVFADHIDLIGLWRAKSLLVFAHDSDN
jgi:hypothetical protein